MSRIAVVTDSNSGITQSEAAQLGIYVVPMPFMIGGETYFEGINLTQADFFEKLKNDVEISTSQPTPDTILTLWDRLLKEYDELVYLPMSSGLSGSCQTGMALAQDYDGRVEVVDNQRISVPLVHAIMDAVHMAEKGKSAAEIKAFLEEDKFNSSIYIMVDTLKYLRKGGRITPAVAAFGSLLKIKPVLQIQGEKLDTFAKARTLANARQIMLTAILNDVTKRFGLEPDSDQMYIDFAYTGDAAAAEAFRAEVLEHFPNAQSYIAPLSLSIACHTGPGALGIAVTLRNESDDDVKREER